jgi:hypothetical protein
MSKLRDFGAGLCCAGVSLALLGCSAGEELGTTRSDLTEDQKILALMDARGFDQSQIVFFEEHVILEDDIYFTRAQLLSEITEAEAQGTDFRAEAAEIKKGYWYRTTATPLPVQTFTLCMDNQLSGQPATAFDRAAKVWSHATFDGAKLAINIVSGDCSSFDDNQIITVFFETPPGNPGAWAAANFPQTSGGITRPGPNIWVNPGTAPGSAEFAAENQTQQLKIAIHEVGHTLGFHHPGAGNHVASTANEGSNPGYLTVMRQGLTEIDHLEPDDHLTASILYDGADFGCPAFNPSSPGTAFCSEACPCTVGEGDCDSDAQCAYGLECATDRGAEYGLPSNYEVCLKPASCPNLNTGSPSTAFCANHASCPCGVGEGDCDGDHECGGDLVCGTDNGPAVGLPSNYDVCKSPPPAGCPAFDPGDLSTAFCSASCPCSLGEGDCDSDAQCQGDLVCEDNVGASFGMPADWDVCVQAGIF